MRLARSDGSEAAKVQPASGSLRALINGAEWIAGSSRAPAPAVSSNKIDIEHHTVNVAERAVTVFIDGAVLFFVMNPKKGDNIMNRQLLEQPFNQDQIKQRLCIWNTIFHMQSFPFTKRKGLPIQRSK